MEQKMIHYGKKKKTLLCKGKSIFASYTLLTRQILNSQIICIFLGGLITNLLFYGTIAYHKTQGKC